MTATDALAAAVGEGIRLDADLRLSVDGRPVTLTGHGRRLTLRVADLRDLAHLGAALPGARRRASELRGIAGGLDALGLTLDVIDGDGVRFARLGREAAGGVGASVLRTPVALGNRTAGSLVLAVLVAVAAVTAVGRLLRGLARR